MKKKRCDVCEKWIDLEKDKHVLLGTYSGKKVLNESYNHWQCFKDHWETRVRKQAENIVKDMANKVLPLAKNIVGGLRS